MSLSRVTSQMINLSGRGHHVNMINKLSGQLLETSQINQCQPTRNVVIVKRKYPIGVERQPGRELKPFKNRHKLYEFVEDTQHKTKKSVKVILTEDVPGIGLKYDIVAVRKGTVRNRLIPENLAVYASPENLEERAQAIKESAMGAKRLSLLAQETIQHMQSKPLRIAIHEDQEWKELERERVLHAFKMDGVHVPDYALKLPDEPVTEFGEYQIYVTVNGVKTVPVDMHVTKQEREKVEESDTDDINPES